LARISADRDPRAALQPLALRDSRDQTPLLRDLTTEGHARRPSCPRQCPRTSMMRPGGRGTDCFDTPWLTRNHCGMLSKRLALATLLVGAAGLSLVAQDRDRSKVPVELTWNLADIYPTEAAWRTAKDALAADIPKLAQFQGKLASSPKTLADALIQSSKLDEAASKLTTYAGLVADQDSRDAARQGLKQEMEQLDATLAGAEAFIQPEILAMPAGTVNKAIAAEPRLGPYKFSLQDIERRRAHTLSAGEEALLAAAAPLSSASSDTYNILANADFPYPTIQISDGKGGTRSIKVDQAAFNAFRASPDRADREKVMSAFFKSLGTFSNTFGTTLSGEVAKVRFYAEARHYKTDVESELDPNNIPVTVYTRLVDGVTKNLGTFQRYLALRKRMMGLSELHYYDLYAPLVKSVDLKYTPEQAEALVLDAVKPLGPDYQATVSKAFKSRWIDFMPTAGKVSGAYSNGGAYDVHPYMLINFNGQYADVSTVAHEMGHTMQSYYSNKTQPFVLANYPIFVAEVASTFNENLLIRHMLDTVKDPDTRLALLGNYLEGFKGTVFRQAQFADFELRVHQLAEAGKPITGEALAKIYLDVTRQYYGHDKGVCIVDDYVAHEWSFIPHFYLDFYVYQYSTSFTASAALAEKVASGDAAAKDRYLKFLAAGGSKYPIDLLKDAGVDMTTDEPLDLTMKTMNRIIDEMEAILKSQGK
jgi:oligoendopeptidase F